MEHQLCIESREKNMNLKVHKGIHVKLLLFVLFSQILSTPLKMRFLFTTFYYKECTNKQGSVPYISIICMYFQIGCRSLQRERNGVQYTIMFGFTRIIFVFVSACLLYTSDAADDMQVCRSRWSPYH